MFLSINNLLLTNRFKTAFFSLVVPDHQINISFVLTQYRAQPPTTSSQKGIRIAGFRTPSFFRFWTRFNQVNNQFLMPKV